MHDFVVQDVKSKEVDVFVGRALCSGHVARRRNKYGRPVVRYIEGRRYKLDSSKEPKGTIEIGEHSLFLIWSIFPSSRSRSPLPAELLYALQLPAWLASVVAHIFVDMCIYVDLCMGL